MSGFAPLQEQAAIGRPQGLTLTLSDGRQLRSWQALRVTRSLDTVPSQFEVALADAYADDPNRVAVAPGEPCRIHIDGDLVLTGYVDRVQFSVSSANHTIQVVGRSKVQDIVDCHITPDVLNGMMVKTTSLQDLATKVCAPFGISVVVSGSPDLSLQAMSGGPLQFPAVLTETGWELLERVARYKGVLIYDDPQGNLVLADVAAGEHASGFTQGEHVQAATVSYSIDQRFSIYQPQLLAFNAFGQQQTGGVQYTPATDAGPEGGPAGSLTHRFRPRFIVSEQPGPNQRFAELRAQWEAARRYGRSQAVQLICDSWRDQGKTLWQPNWTAPLNLPAVKLTPSLSWVIGTVTYFRDAQRGTIAELTLMPRQAFQPEPDILVPFINEPKTPIGATPPPPTGAEKPASAPTGQGTSDTAASPAPASGTGASVAPSAPASATNTSQDIPSMVIRPS